jgi:hypothetical protein
LQILWIVAVNDTDRPPGPLHPRLRRVRVGRPTGIHAKAAVDALAARLRAELAWPPGRELPVTPEAWRTLAGRMVRGGIAGRRNGPAGAFSGAGCGSAGSASSA